MKKYSLRRSGSSQFVTSINLETPEVYWAEGWNNPDALTLPAETIAIAAAAVIQEIDGSHCEVEEMEVGL